ncbi:daunorubicin resistance protein DrrA family ABC transporter ATP-binding protein [Rhodococcus aerolatus]
MAVDELVKRYPKRPSNAVDGVSFRVGRGEVFGLLGPNGAGKTTTIGVLTTRVVPTSGRATVGGVDVAADPVRARTVLSVVPQRSNLDRSLTARQNLVFHAAYHGVGRAERNRRADELMDKLGLGGRGGDKVDTYSGGMAQRLLIARALMHRPRVLFLDEPSTGLDPQAKLFVWDQVRALRDAGATVLVTTHDMDEAAAISDRVGIMDHGTLLALDTPAALTRSLPGSSTLDLTVEVAGEGVQDGEQDGAGAERVASALAGLRGVRGSERVSTGADAEVRVRLYLDTDGAAVVGPATEAVSALGARLTAVGLGEPTLEDVFISLTGRDLR